MIQLKEIGEDNFYEVIGLKVHDTQEKFVAPNVRSIAECWLYRENGDTFPYAVYKGDEMVGFLLLDLDAEERKYMIWRMMIDECHQGKGYGRELVEHVIEMARSDDGYDVLIADYVTGNEAMEKLLRTLGFEESGFEEEVNEVVMTLDIQSPLL
ncbi:GNAT family N-acetyltransferase [Salinicoccus halitifaciens]|uniref:Diamine N-acetyltransferase n=1 Tax=Salinicoccus halitifaciens TaxID=1073415 RepID=A0ABV2E828_9STAP|nr:GNAT family N-acetyltransferase [Salinicoccus halitifaciens]MCD2137712.1 GNAT family N-acetyltransferase [Salinicoccus halitifaciens]